MQKEDPNRFGAQQTMHSLRGLTLALCQCVLHSLITEEFALSVINESAKSSNVRYCTKDDLVELYHSMKKKPQLLRYFRR